jgi:hypothetical protein
VLLVVVDGTALGELSGVKPGSALGEWLGAELGAVGIKLGTAPGEEVRSEVGETLEVPLGELGKALGEELGALLTLSCEVGSRSSRTGCALGSEEGRLLTLGRALGGELGLLLILGTAFCLKLLLGSLLLLGWALGSALVLGAPLVLGRELEASLISGSNDDGRLKLGSALGPEEYWPPFTGMVKLLEATAKGTAISLPTMPGPLSLVSLGLDSTDVTVTVTVMSPKSSLLGRTCSVASAASMSSVLPVKVT